MLVRMPVNPIHLGTYETAIDAIRNSPYFYHSYIVRAYIFAHWGLDGLAIGDAYKTLLLIDEITDEAGEYHEQAREAETEHPLEVRQAFPKFKHASLPTWIFDHPRPTFNWKSLDGSKLLAYRLLVYLLTNIGCLQSAWDFYQQSKTQIGTENGEQSLHLHLLRHIRVALGLNSVADEELNIVRETLPDRGLVQRLLYPWNSFEPQRYSEANLQKLNEALQRIAPKLRAEVTELPVLSETGVPVHEKQLGLVAVEDIAPGEEILSETSFLTANSRLYDPLCDACSGELPATRLGESNFVCPDCDDTVFCSQACLDGAMESYHPAVCGSDADTTAKEPVPTDAADALYFLLVGRALAFSEHQDLHPLDLKDTKFLWGEFTTPLVARVAQTDVLDMDSEALFARNPTLPFNFKYNILYPIHYLEKMEVDIYSNVDRYDFWVFETLFAKFRGVASGKMSAQGVPEVSAVHSLWCLANHSCAPNVKWEWSGNMRFWARKKEELVEWGSPGRQAVPIKWNGVSRGEDILSHYCEIGLDVQSRREWAQGALGGDCRCSRCIWESGETVQAA